MEKLCLMKVFMEVVKTGSVDGGVGNLQVNLKIIYMPIRDKRIFGILTGKAVKMKNRQFSILRKSLSVSVFWKSRISTK